MEHSDENHDSVSSRLYDIDSSDPRGELVDRSAMDTAQLRGISALMRAFARLREAEQELSALSMKFMKLNQTDMRALHYLIVSSNNGEIATPGRMAVHLKISSASTTKLLDRLERAGHISRASHPTDRRALAISITPETHEAAMHSVGRQQAKRFHAAARLTDSEREIVIRFLDDMTDEITTFDGTWTEA